MSVTDVSSGDVIENQMSAILLWFVNWTFSQREDFLNDLLHKAVPNKLMTVLDALDNLAVHDSEQTVFKCQLRLFSQWFNGWSDAQRNFFLGRLSEIDAAFVDRLNSRVEATCGQL
jgi:hypothetical protein